MISLRKFRSCMLNIVMAKPIQFTMVKAVPFDDASALCATMVEKRGESPITNTPQSRRKAMKTAGEPMLKKNGESRQQAQDNPSARRAIFFVPNEPDR